MQIRQASVLPIILFLWPHNYFVSLTLLLSLLCKNLSMEMWYRHRKCFSLWFFLFCAFFFLLGCTLCGSWLILGSVIREHFEWTWDTIWGARDWIWVCYMQVKLLAYCTITWPPPHILKLYVCLPNYLCSRIDLPKHNGIYYLISKITDFFI